MSLLTRYQEALINIPPPGCGCHIALLGVSNLGILSGLQADQIFDDIRQAIPSGRRRISDHEILDAINKALSDHGGETFTKKPRPEPIVKDGKAAFQKIIDQGRIDDEADLWEVSPIWLLDEPQNDWILLFSALFNPTDLIFIGERHDSGVMGETIRTTSEWIAHFQNGGTSGPFIIINPLNGIPAPTKMRNKATLRGDSNVKEFRYCLAEFDNLSRKGQIKFWSAVKLPIVALIDSGGKSLHAWLEVSKLAQVQTLERWQAEIKVRLYDRILTPLGVDSACSNPARLSRLPGHYRIEKQAYQRFLWLSPEGRSIC